MASLHQLLASHGRVLVLDAASARVQVGWLDGEGEGWESSDEEAGIGIFRCLDRLARPIESVGACVFCDGPGSILGIRTAAMALRSWSVLHELPAYAYCSLALIAETMAPADVTVIADARRDSWHALRRGQPLRRLAAADLSGRLVTPENFRHWSPLPSETTLVPYALPSLLPATADADLFRHTSAPDAFLHEEPSYVTWTPRIHRAPS